MVDAVLIETLKKEVIMPGRDKTGPEGMGPLTGRQMGLCVGDDRLASSNLGRGYGRGYGRGFGRGFGYGRGLGRGFGYGRGYYFDETAPNVKEKTVIENEIRLLKDQVSSLEEQLKKVEGKD
jgi:hypothetical protein